MRYAPKSPTRGRSQAATEALAALWAAGAALPVQDRNRITDTPGALRQHAVAELVERGEARWVRRGAQWWAEAT